MREHIEIKLKEGADTFKTVEQLNTFQHIKARVVDCSTVRLWFNSEKIVAKKLVKLVASLSNPVKGTKKRNIQSIKQLQ